MNHAVNSLTTKSHSTTHSNCSHLLIFYSGFLVLVINLNKLNHIFAYLLIIQHEMKFFHAHLTVYSYYNIRYPTFNELHDKFVSHYQYFYQFNILFY